MDKTQAFSSWIDIFNEDLLNSFNNEITELKKAAMIVTAFKNELKRVQEAIENNYNTLKQEIEEKNKENQCLNNRPTISIPNNEETKLFKNSTLDSPDIFPHVSINKSSDSTIGSSTLEEDSDKSPTLISKRKRPKKPIIKRQQLKKNVFKNVDKDTSVIPCTPEVPIKRSTCNKKKTTSKKNKNNCTLTQMFSDITRIGPKLDQVEGEDDVTFIKEDSNRELGITRLLSLINKTDNGNEVTLRDEEMNSSQDVDEFSKGVLFNESQIDDSPQKKDKNILVEPVVRGGARKLLNGFSCRECRDFYGALNLPPEELKEKMDECSKHRYKYQPVEDTYKGIWDLSIAAEGVKK